MQLCDWLPQHKITHVTPRVEIFQEKITYCILFYMLIMYFTIKHFIEVYHTFMIICFTLLDEIAKCTLYCTAGHCTVADCK